MADKVRCISREIHATCHCYKPASKLWRRNSLLLDNNTPPCVYPRSSARLLLWFGQTCQYDSACPLDELASTIPPVVRPSSTVRFRLPLGSPEPSWTARFLLWLGRTDSKIPSVVYLGYSKIPSWVHLRQTARLLLGFIST